MNEKLTVGPSSMLICLSTPSLYACNQRMEYVPLMNYHEVNKYSYVLLVASFDAQVGTSMELVALLYWHIKKNKI